MSKNKHHYIPQFYLKLFTNDNGNYHVFDKKYNKFRNDPQSPKTSFFEYNRNIIKINNLNTDVLEKLYSDFENNFAKFLKYITSTHYEIEILDNRDLIYTLKCYIAMQFWRLPFNDFYIDKYILNINKKSCRNILVDNNGNNFLDDNICGNLIKKDKYFRYYFRCFILPFLFFNIFSHDDNMETWRIYNTEKDNRFSFICADSPIIFNNINDFIMFKGKIFFPLTKNKILLISENGFPDNFPDSYWAYINMALYEQSNRYLTVLDKNYLFELQNIYQDINIMGMSNLFRDYLFK
jgi:hypothetical protein